MYANDIVCPVENAKFLERRTDWSSEPGEATKRHNPGPYQPGGGVMRHLVIFVKEPSGFLTLFPQLLQKLEQQKALGQRPGHSWQEDR